MFISFDNGARWQRFNNNLPVVPINDIKVHRKDLVIATQGRGFWIMDNLTPLHQAGAALASAPAHLFRPRDAFRYRFGGGRGRLGAAAPEYPAAGAQIDYFLPAPVSGDVRLEISDSSGRVVRTFSSEGAPRPQGEGPRDPDDDMRPGGGGGGGARLTRNVGLNRFTWDLRYPGPWNAATRGPAPGGGPTALPGTYSVKLIVGAHQARQSLIVHADPRNSVDGVTLADLAEQFRVGVQVRDLVSDVNQLVAQVRDARRRLANATGPAADTLRVVTALEQKLVTPPVRYSKPALQAHITYLYSLTNQADQRIGRDVIERYAVLRRQLDALKLEARAIPGLVADQ
jgi:hypothetical protein